MNLVIKYRSTQGADDILFRILFDNKEIHRDFLDGKSKTVVCPFDDCNEDTIRTLCLVMSGKSSHHTMMDDDGTITSDCAIIVESIIVDEIDVTDLWCQGSKCYEHDGNGSCPQFVDQFYGYMGCNGIIKLEFLCPLYKWFLQHSQ